jgi:hypothetical protein
VQQVTQLLSMCLHLERLPVPHDEFDSEASFDSDSDEEEALEYAAPCFQAVCALPAAKAISASSLASLVRLAAKLASLQARAAVVSAACSAADALAAAG